MEEILARKIERVTVRFLNQCSLYEVKVHINNHIYPEANIQIDPDSLIKLGVIRRKTGIKKAEEWLNNNK